MAIDHDRLFKELIQMYFAEFIQLFFPQVFTGIDFEHLTFLSEEIFTDIVTGERRRVDLLVKTKLKGKDYILIVHIEAQSYYQKDFAERMFIYSSRLFEKYRCCILPIVVFSYDSKNKVEPTKYSWGLPFFKVMKYQFYTVELRKKNWRHYIKQDNPIAAALLSKMKYTKEEKVQVKKEFLRMLLRLELDPARMYLIAGFFDTYMILDDKEKQSLWEELQMLEPRESELLKLQPQWVKDGVLQGIEQGIEQGIGQGIEKGKLEEACTFISKFIRAQFGEEHTKKMLMDVASLTNLIVLEQLADQLFRVTRLEDAQKLVSEACNEL
ncbi:transposase [Paenibacillus psychroresistens]|uniref:Transposase n=1 Tax=Paenibacillus psychroresistens TaxID=1778678 RepID=A0A6B8RGG6_9BACL|nr:Rpn family recombination-promoting nuclease/putative transposase [Paenibacillus psychroresistens]QGQ94814.1 transposase [Paenibacillus psychroresistens]